MNVSCNKIITSYSAPSNIAVIKYWGKRSTQLPCNPSISFTLSSAITTTKLTAEPSGKFEVNFVFEKTESLKFQKKVEDYIQLLSQSFSVLRNYHYKFESKNSFPHSAGIASSASSFASIALCLSDVLGITSKQEISQLARLGSGSAARSLYGGAVLWGEINPNLGSDTFATPLKIHPIWSDLQDAIIIIESGEKSVSSSKGHSLMNEHPYATARFATAKSRAIEMLSILETGDTERFSKLVERDALDLHAMMMSAAEPYILMKSGTITAIERIKSFMRSHSVFLTYTLDAGPNIHLLYFKKDELVIKDFLRNEIIKDSITHKIIYDAVGSGPEHLC